MVMTAYNAPITSTLQFGDLYNGAPSYAAPAVEQTNPGGTGNVVAQAAAQGSPVASAPTGLEVPTLVVLFICAFLLVRFY